MKKGTIFGELSPVGYAIVLKNYPGDRSVLVRDEKGQQREVTRSHFFIDSVFIHL